MMQMIAGAMEAQRSEPLGTSQDTVSPPRNVPMLLDIARFRNEGLLKQTPYQCLSKIDDADTFRQHEVTDGSFQQEKQRVTPAVCALKIRVSLVRFRSWAPFYFTDFISFFGLLAFFPLRFDTLIHWL
jgi:hypothetical protein